MCWTVFYLRVPTDYYFSHQIYSGQGAVHHANFPQSLKHKLVIVLHGIVLAFVH